MKILVFFLIILSVILSGCASGGTSADQATEQHNMEQKINDQALRDNPPPPGEGPSN